MPLFTPRPSQGREGNPLHYGALIMPRWCQVMPQSNPRKGREGKGRIYQVIEGNPLLHDAPNYAHINYCIINYEIINAPCNLPDPAFITPPFNPSTKPKSKIPLKPAPLFTYKYHPLWDLENRYLSGLPITHTTAPEHDGASPIVIRLRH